MKSTLMKFLLVTLTTFTFNVSQAQIDSTLITIGKYITIKSKVLKEERQLQIHLPNDYNDTKIKYPVLFLLDGPTHFNYTTALVDYQSGNWHHMPKMIIVGIPNTNRNRDFLPNKCANIPQSGGADEFIRFFNEELIPFISKQYRAADYRVIFGHSFGGAFALHTITTKPETFDAYIVCGSGHPRDTTLLPMYNSKFQSFSELDKFLYITIADGDPEKIIEGNKKLKKVLDSYAPSKLKWAYRYMENEDHMSLALISLYDGLKSLFPNWRITRELIDKGATEFNTHLLDLKREYGYNVVFPEEIFWEICDYYVSKEMNEDAEILLKMYKKEYPASLWPYSLLAGVYLNLEKKEMAIINYEKCLVIDPKNEEIINILKELKEEE